MLRAEAETSKAETFHDVVSLDFPAASNAIPSPAQPLWGRTENGIWTDISLSTIPKTSRSSSCNFNSLDAVSPEERLAKLRKAAVAELKRMIEKEKSESTVVLETEKAQCGDMHENSCTEKVSREKEKSESKSGKRKENNTKAKKMNEGNASGSQERPNMKLQDSLKEITEDQKKLAALNAINGPLRSVTTAHCPDRELTGQEIWQLFLPESESSDSKSNCSDANNGDAERGTSRALAQVEILSGTEISQVKKTNEAKAKANIKAEAAQDAKAKAAQSARAEAAQNAKAKSRTKYKRKNRTRCKKPHRMQGQKPHKVQEKNLHQKKGLPQ